MADQDVALQVKTPPLLGPYNPASPLLAAQAIQGGQTGLQEAQTQLQMLNRRNAGEDIQFQNQLIRDAAQKGAIGGSQAWDAAMQAAVDRGATGAAQYIGRYTDLLPSRVFAAYGGAAAPAAGTATTAGAGGGGVVTDEMRDRQYQNMSAPQLTQNLAKNNVIAAALTGIRDQQTHDAAIRTMINAGVPQAAQIVGPYTPLNVAHIEKLYNIIQGNIDYLQGRVAEAATGAPPRPIKNEVQNVGDVAYSVDPYRGTATAMTPPKPEKIGTDLGNDIYGVRDPNAPGGFRRIDTDSLVGAGTPVSIANAAARIQPIENATGNPAAKNPLSSATGNDQFINKTWLDTIKKAYPDLAKDFSDDQLLTLRTNPAFSASMTVELAKANAASLNKANVPVTTATIALAHRFGAEGAAKIFDAAPNTPMEQVVSAAALKANPQLAGQTTGAYVQGFVKQVGNDPVTSGAGGTAAAPAGQRRFDPAQLPPGVDPTTGIDPKTGRNEGFLLTRPVNDRGLIKGLADYNIDPNAVGYRQKAAVQGALTTYDSTYRSDIYPVIKSTEEAFTKGKQGDQVRFFNNSIQHMTTLQRYADAMQNGDTRILNSLKNTIQTQLGVAAPNTFDGLKNVVGQEIVKSIVPGGGGEAERQEVAKTLATKSSPAQITSMLEGYKELGGAQLRDLKVQYENGTYHKRNDFDDKLIPESRDILAKILSGRAGPGGTGATAAPTPPVPGAKLYQGVWYQRGPNGESVPVPVKQ